MRHGWRRREEGEKKEAEVEVRGGDVRRWQATVGGLLNVTWFDDRCSLDPVTW